MNTTMNAVTLPAFPLTESATGLCESDDKTDQDFSQLKILIVDDSRFYRLVIMSALAPFRLTNVTEAADGKDALEALRTQDIDILLVDYEMPEINGADLIRLIRWTEDETINAKVPIIMISNFAEQEVVLAARNAGVHEFISKPIVPSELYKRIRSSMDSSREFIVTDDYRGPDRRWIPRDQD